MASQCPLTNEACARGNCEANGLCMSAMNMGEVLSLALPNEAEFESMKAAERRAEVQLAAQHDSLEAHSLKYNHPAQIMCLSSGHFALFGPFVNGQGIELFAIGDWASLETHVREYRATVDVALERGQRVRTPATEARAKASYDALFGDDQ